MNGFLKKSKILDANKALGKVLTIGAAECAGVQVTCIAHATLAPLLHHDKTKGKGKHPFVN